MPTRFSLPLSCLFVLLAGACRPAGAGTVPGGLEPATREAAVFPVVLTETPTSASLDDGAGLPVEIPAEPTAGGSGPAATEPAFQPCSDNLTFMGDLTYPDRTPVLAGQPLEKRWKVRNSGLCDWGPDYRFRWVGGSVLSTRQEFALYPAVAGSEAVLTVLLTAPLAPGEYISSWRAFSPLGAAFGDTLYIDVIVS